MSLDLDELRAELHRLSNKPQNNRDFSGYVRMPESDGWIQVRLLPPRPGTKQLFAATRTHQLGASINTFHCPQVLVGSKWQGSCPICDEWRAIWKKIDRASGDEKNSLVAQAGDIKARQKFYYNCIQRSLTLKETGEVKKDVGPLILPIGQKLHERILRAICGDPSMDEPELGDVADLTAGRDFKIIKKVAKSGKNDFPSYDDSKFLGTTPAGTAQQIEKWMAELHDLSVIRQVLPLADLQARLDEYRGGMNGSQPTSNVINEAKATPVAAKVANVVKQVEESGDEVIADDDFLKELRSM